MTVTAVVGAQYGDEGKGRIVDYLAQEANLVIRFQGGDNAGHTVVNDQGKFALHLVPSGIFNPDTANVIGTGCVVNPLALMDEIETLAQAGVDTRNLWISSRAQMLLPYHREQDELEERAREPGQEIGTTKRGIGPAYVDKMARSGLRMGDLLDSLWLEERLENALARTNRYMSTLGASPVDVAAMFAVCQQARDALADRIIDTVPLVRNALVQDHEVLLEGQLGIMRDLDWGIYPFVTSSNPTAAYAAVGAGMPMQAIQRVIGIAKAYSTAVGTGPFPTELEDGTGQKLRDVGGEYGATTGRPRRCGWLDLVPLRFGAWLNGLTDLAITKVDVLDAFESIRVCTHYELPDGRQEAENIPDTPLLVHAKPCYREFAGWQESTVGCRVITDLPPQAQAFLAFIQDHMNLPIPLIGVGPERSQIIVN